MSALVNDGSDIINKKLNVKVITNDHKNLDNYEIDSTIDWIKKNNFKKIGLQFPDELLPVSIPISLLLKDKSSSHFGIMADTSFGSCCVDEVGGEHFSVDAIVHYGNACLTSTHRKLPVKYVFGDYNFDDSDLKHHVKTIEKYLRTEISEETDKICLSILYDFRYLRFSKAVVDNLRSSGLCTHLSVPNLTEYQLGNSENVERFGNRLVEICPKQKLDCQHVVVFIGDSFDHSVKAALLSARHRWATMLLYSSVTNTIRDISNEITRVLRSRLYSVEVARSARRVGLLMGTLSADRFVELSSQIAALMRRHGKRVYPVVVGKINAAKLANFADLDALVLVSCPETSLQFSERGGDGADFLRPVVTPYEMCCACGVGFGDAPANLLTDKYRTDYRELLVAMATTETEEEELAEQDASLEMSLVSGKIVALGLRGADSSTDCDGALISRRDADWTVAVEERSARSWFGLDPQLGQTSVSMVTEGRSGIALGYENEPNQ